VGVALTGIALMQPLVIGLGLAVPVGYLAVVLLVSLTAREPGIRSRLLLVYPTMHLAWGTGFWRGVRQ
jgi:succinoglycan biosynthesis protein ExoA